VIEGYPESAEARESIIALANIGVARRKMKLQPSMAGWDAFVNPLDAYDDLLRKNPSEDLVERLLYLKGDALIKYGRYEESLDVNRYLLVRCPKGDYNADIKRNLKHAGKVLIHRYYERGDHAAVADMYFKTYAKALISMDDAQLMVKIRESLNRIGLTDDAAGISLLASGEKKAGRDISTLPEFPEGVKGKAGKEIVRVENILKLLEGNAAGDERIPQGLKALLGDLYYGKGMYEQAARNYDEVMWLGLDVDDPARTHLHYADTLRALNRCPEAEGHYRHAVDAINAEKPSSRPDVLADAYMGLGDCQYRQGRFEKGLANYEMAEKCASDRRRRSWSVYGVVRGLVNLAKEQELEKAFARLRAGSEEEFWPKVVAYLSADREWMEAYGEYVADGQAR
ncbi:MAG: tetratricopeptide repeat protein, partial [Deltaproteobacteria bacterium]|nr:tetratricopeptide repeat protein [Deltaproteobacteria bacterium]